MVNKQSPSGVEKYTYQRYGYYQDMHVTRSSRRAILPSSPTTAQINALRAQVIVSPIISFLLTTLLGAGISLAVLTVPKEAEPNTSGSEFLQRYLDWLKSLPTTVGADLDVTATLLALGALTLTIFFTLNTSNNGDDSTEPAAIQAQRVVLNELSIITAIIAAVLAWLAIPLIGFAPEDVPAILLTIGIAVLCSAVIPLHHQRAVAVRLSLVDARHEIKNVESYLATLEGAPKFKYLRYFQKHTIMGITAWILAIAAINATLGLAYVYYVSGNLNIMQNGAYVFIVFILILSCLWAIFTLYCYIEVLLAKARKRNKILQFAPAILYTITTLSGAILGWGLYKELGGAILTGLLVISSSTIHSIAWFIDRRHTHLLDKCIVWNLTNRINFLVQRVATLELNLARSTHARHLSPIQRERPAKLGDARPPRLARIPK